ncbi:hypothetical protein G5B46_18730 [Caulobacter sp. 602-2]|uniref:Uncharacterized protein n=1 Tax=Caulobacter sp. 602-2 TaxID=2710887 RepID=A0A6G4R1I6_9CAUL|nr:hypothetical protein [Caulobacter sp. 602-2]NGM51652.1 hypothetical protein [Caulobacter sp. 602-2]
MITLLATAVLASTVACQDFDSVSPQLCQGGNLSGDLANGGRLVAVEEADTIRIYFKDGGKLTKLAQATRPSAKGLSIKVAPAGRYPLECRGPSESDCASVLQLNRPGVIIGASEGASTLFYFTHGGDTEVRSVTISR